MNRKLMKKLEMAAGVVEFQRNNPFTDKSQVAIAAQFATKREEADALARAEHRESLAARAAVRDAQELRRGLEHLLPSVASIGTFALRGDAQGVSRFVAPAVSKSRAAFLTEAASLVEAAREHQGALARHGFTKAQLKELAGRLQQFQSATTEVKNVQHRLRETRAKLARALTELGDLLRLLDAFHRVRFEHDPDLLQVWATLRTVSGGATRKRSGPASAAPVNPAPSVTPSTPPVAQPTTAPPTTLASPATAAPAPPAPVDPGASPPQSPSAAA